MTNIKLQHPVQIGEETISEISLDRRIRWKDLRAAEAAAGLHGLTGAITVLAARMSGLDPDVFDELDADDATAVLAAVNEAAEKLNIARN